MSLCSLCQVHSSTEIASTSSESSINQLDMTRRKHKSAPSTPSGKSIDSTHPQKARRRSLDSTSNQPLRSNSRPGSPVHELRERKPINYAEPGDDIKPVIIQPATKRVTAAAAAAVQSFEQKSNEDAQPPRKTFTLEQELAKIDAESDSSSSEDARRRREAAFVEANLKLQNRQTPHSSTASTTHAKSNESDDVDMVAVDGAKSTSGTASESKSPVEPSNNAAVAVSNKSSGSSPNDAARDKSKSRKTSKSRKKDSIESPEPIDYDSSSFQSAIESQLRYVIEESQSVIHRDSDKFSFDAPGRTEYTDESLYDSKPSLIHAVVPAEKNSDDEQGWMFVPLIQLGTTPDGQCTNHAVSMSFDIIPYIGEQVDLSLFDYGTGIVKNALERTKRFRAANANYLRQFLNMTNSDLKPGEKWQPEPAILSTEAYREYQHICSALGIPLHNPVALKKHINEFAGIQPTDQDIVAINAIRLKRETIEYRYANPAFLKKDQTFETHTRLDCDKQGGLVASDYFMHFTTTGVRYNYSKQVPGYNQVPYPQSILHYSRNNKKKGVGHTEVLIPAPFYHFATYNNPMMESVPTRMIPMLYYPNPTQFFTPYLCRRQYINQEDRSVHIRVGSVIKLVNEQQNESTAHYQFVVATSIRLSRTYTAKCREKVEDKNGFDTACEILKKPMVDSGATVYSTKSESETLTAEQRAALPMTPLELATCIELPMKLDQPPPSYQSIVDFLASLDSKDEISFVSYQLGDIETSINLGADSQVESQVFRHVHLATKGVVAEVVDCTQQRRFAFSDKLIHALRDYFISTTGLAQVIDMESNMSRPNPVVHAYHSFLRNASNEGQRAKHPGLSNDFSPLRTIYRDHLPHQNEILWPQYLADRFFHDEGDRQRGVRCMKEDKSIIYISDGSGSTSGSESESPESNVVEAESKHDSQSKDIKKQDNDSKSKDEDGIQEVQDEENDNEAGDDESDEQENEEGDNADDNRDKDDRKKPVDNEEEDKEEHYVSDRLCSLLD